ncbi:MAG: hypothetical protein ACXU71_10180, partial [Croceibacterium sp.]
MPKDSGQAGTLVPVTPAMLDAGVAEFEVWFDRPENAEDMVGMPSQASLRSFLSSSFRSMI